MQNIKSLFLLLLSCFFGGCTSSAIFEDYRNIPQEKWAINSDIQFEVEIPQNGDYDFILCIRHTTDYEMANLWCFLTVADSTRTIRKDSVNIMVAEADGKWKGKGNLLKTLEYPLPDPYALNTGKYFISVKQGMRTPTLKGIKNVGLIVRSGSSVPTTIE
ncbi:gliding motility lipoprotein GldH [Odoribacter laneus]|uniref:gliding motility lipoprotein GldH n=1 Tax=Odoribacter laneus TaxID=626933 RepID=UPI00399612C0